MTLAEQWREIEAALPEDWSSARLELTVAEDERADEAALMLAPFAPGRTGSTFRLTVHRATHPERVLRRLDAAGVRGLLDLLGAEQPTSRPEPPERSRPLVEQWDELASRLPPDWSDV